MEQENEFKLMLTEKEYNRLMRIFNIYRAHTQMRPFRLQSGGLIAS